MPLSNPKKQSKRLWEWQRYVKKETQRLAKNDEKLSSEISKPPLPKLPDRPKNTARQNAITQSQARREISREELKQIESEMDFEDDINVMMDDTGVELDETLSEWVEPGIENSTVTQERPVKPIKKKPVSRPVIDQSEKVSRTETLELFGAELEKARRKRRNPRKTREHLIENLLDPVISLDEAAVILNVCKTTVRRYTNGGKLECLRTPGNQRRFKLSTVLEFLEEKEGKKASQM